MKKIIALSALTFSITAFSACDSSTPAVDPTATPNADQMKQEAQNAAPISSDALNQIASIMKTNSSKVPDAYLMVTDSDATDGLDSDGLALLSDIQGDCAFMQLYPVDGTGDQMGSLSGSACPVQILVKRNENNNLSNDDGSNVSGNATTVVTTNYSVTDSSEQQTTGMTSMTEVDTKSTTYDNSPFDSTIQLTSGSTSINETITFTLNLSNGDILQGSFQGEVKAIAGHKSSNEVFKLTHKADTLIIGIFQTDQNTPLIYINGQASTTDQLNSQFGIDLSQSSSN